MAGNMTLASNNDFKSWVLQMKQDIRSAQVKAAIKVNTELLRLYWHMGADICEKQKSASWGDGWLKKLSRELMAEFPDMKGLSYRNLKYIRQWYQFYNEQLIIRQQVVAQLDDANMQQPVAQISEEVFFSVPWGHHLYIISQCKDVDRAIFYLLKKTVENGWSRAILLNFLDTNLYERQGKAVNNFSRLLADPQSELATQTLKDPYNFDFLTLDGEYRERELEPYSKRHSVLTRTWYWLRFCWKSSSFAGRRRDCISRLAFLSLGTALLCGRRVENYKIQSRAFGAIRGICERGQSY